MGAAIELAVPHFHAMTDDRATAVSAFRRHRMDRTFETVEHVFFSTQHHFKRFIIFVSTNFTFSHRISFLSQPCEGFKPSQGF
jgi:hypothetical protein